MKSELTYVMSNPNKEGKKIHAIWCLLFAVNRFCANIENPGRSNTDA